MPSTAESSRRYQRTTVASSTTAVAMSGTAVLTATVVLDGVSYVVEVTVPARAMQELARAAVANAGGRATAGGMTARVKG